MSILASDIVSSDTRERARRVADELIDQRQLTEALEPFDRLRYADDHADRPSLHLEDVSGIPFVSEIPGVAEYQYRARVRADTGDLFAAVTDPVEGYEAYCRDQLGLGAPEFFQPKPAGGPMEIGRACAHAENIEHIADFARSRGGLVVHPYMAIEAVWEIADELDRRGVAASVLGPPPPVLWIANDKSALAEVIDRVADGAWNVETRRAHTPHEMVDRLVDMAGRHPRVGLKRTRCASAMGNIVYESAMLRGAGAAEIDRNVRQFLHRTEWEDDETVLVVEWADNAESPSTQMWIPPAAPDGGESGQVRLDGVYQQILSGPERVFVGSRPSTLPERVNRALAEASFIMATTFQRLGYVGRCSFDFIIVGDPEGDFDIRMTECNGRWGGTSTPMHLVDRLVAGPRPAYVAQDFFHPDLVGASLSQVLEAVGDELFDPKTQQGRFIFFNPGPLAEHGKIDAVCLGETPGAAQEGIQRVLPDLLGLS